MAVYQHQSVLSDHLCECGCGARTFVATKTQASKGVVKGQPRRFVAGHQPKPGPRRTRPLPGDPSGRLCACGCGRETLQGVARPRKYLDGHTAKPKQLALVVGRPRRRQFRVDENGCWVWLLKIDPRGYAAVTEGGLHSKAHRVYYERFKGPIPDGFHIHHECRNKACVNPDHLTAVSRDEHSLIHLRDRLGDERVRELLDAA